MKPDQTNEDAPKLTETTAASAPSEGRRKFTGAGLAGGVMLTVASRSALGGWGTCTGSEIASGNLSRQGKPNPCGCSPGFWWNAQKGIALWNNSPALNINYTKTKLFNTVFGVQFFNANVTLWDVFTVSVDKLGPVPASCRNEPTMPVVAFHAVAALLNAAYYGSRYPVFSTPSAVISAFQAAFVGGCDSLTAFKNKVDIYSTWPELWCAGSEE